MLGHRGCRLGITHPEIYGMQARAIMEAACTVAEQGIRVEPEIMIPLTGTVGEMKETFEQTRRVADGVIAENEWNGERLFQVAKFGTEMQYQHLVFEEFARTIQPNIDLFFAPTHVYDVNLDPSIVAEFAHTVYRFGHSMLTETVDRLDADFNVVGQAPGSDQQLGLIEAFLNPLAFAASGPRS